MPKDKRDRDTTDHREAGDSREKGHPAGEDAREEYTGYRETRDTRDRERAADEAEARREAGLQPSEPEPEPGEGDEEPPPPAAA